jgi:hypothetical protein
VPEWHESSTTITDFAWIAFSFSPISSSVMSGNARRAPVLRHDRLVHPVFFVAVSGP